MISTWVLSGIPDGSGGLAAWSGYSGATSTCLAERSLLRRSILDRRHAHPPVQPLYLSIALTMTAIPDMAVLIRWYQPVLFPMNPVRLYEDLSVPFTDNISCITRYADGSTNKFFYSSLHFPVGFQCGVHSRRNCHHVIPMRSSTGFFEEYWPVVSSAASHRVSQLHPSTASNKLYRSG